MARNFYRIFTESNPVMEDSKTFGIPEAKGLSWTENLLHPHYSLYHLSYPALWLEVSQIANINIHKVFRTT